MNTKNRRSLLLFFFRGGVLLTAGAVPLLGETPAVDAQPPEPAWESRLGVAAVSRPVSPGVDKYRVTPLPFIDVAYRHRLFLSTERGLGAVVWGAGGFSLEGALHFDLGRKEDWAPEELHGLGDINAAAVAVAALRYRNGGNVAALKARRALGGYDGLRVEFSGGRQWRLKNGLRLTLEGYLAYADDPTAGAFYGIDAVQAAASGRAAFHAGAGLERSGGRLRLGRSIGEHWGAAVVLDHGWLLGDARRSPLTTRDSQLMQLSLAVFRQF